MRCNKCMGLMPDTSGRAVCDPCKIDEARKLAEKWRDAYDAEHCSVCGMGMLDTSLPWEVDDE